MIDVSDEGRDLRKAVQEANKSLAKCRDPDAIRDEIEDRYPGCGACSCWCGKGCCDCGGREGQFLPQIELSMGEAAVPYGTPKFRSGRPSPSALRWCSWCGRFSARQGK
jgi:hypothetical protein